MTCRKCGELLDDHVRFCPACGEPQKQASATTLNPRHSHESHCAHGAPGAPMGFLTAVKLFFRRCLDFKGRSRRSEYWWVCLFTSLAGFLVGLLLPELVDLWSVILFIPSLSLAVRRLHDIGKSGWWYLLLFVPLVGSVLLIIWFCKDGDPLPNKWGRSPKA